MVTDNGSNTYSWHPLPLGLMERIKAKGVFITISKELVATAANEHLELYSVPAGSTFYMTALEMVTNNTGAGPFRMMDAYDATTSDPGTNTGRIRCEYAILASYASNGMTVYSIPRVFKDGIWIHDFYSGKLLGVNIEGYLLSD